MNKKNKLIFVVGKTSSGKDTVAKFIQETWDIPMICSYATRPMRAYEVNGVQHYFISDERMNEILKTEKVLAYTKSDKTGIQYCSTIEAMTSDTMVYIINPEGIKWFKENGCFDDVDFFSIYVDLDEDIIIERAMKRGDDIKDIKSRLDSERDDMDSFKETNGYDYIIDNSEEYVDLISNVTSILISEGF